MDYQRIYREFIADRKSKPTPAGYTERHHIVPRSLGGGDEPDNLIVLTAEDHFFAHLLLAKAHNTMAAWGAVMVMHERGLRSDIIKKKARQRYAWARARYSAWCSTERLGADNPNYNPELVALKTAGREPLYLTRIEWSRQHSIPHAALCGLITGKSRSYKGWMLPDTCPSETGRDYASTKRRKNQAHRWVHSDGRESTAGIYDLAAEFGLRVGDLASIVRGEHVMHGGWRMAGTRAGWPCGRLHFRDEREHEFIHVDGRIIKGVQQALIKLAGIDQREVSAVVNGRRKSASGWMMRATADSGYKPRLWKR